MTDAQPGLVVTSGTAVGAVTIRNTFDALIGDGVTTSHAIQHDLGTLDVIVAVYFVATGERVFTGLSLTSEDVVTVRFAVAPRTNEYRVVVQR